MAFEPIDPKNLSPRQFRGLVRNVRNIYDQTDARTRAAGRDWYPQAHDIATEVGRKAGGDNRTGSGIVAALSPGQDWDLNIAQAHQFSELPERTVDSLRRGDRSELAGTPLNKQSTENILKAQRIREGEQPEDVLPMRKKTGNFFRNVNDPSDPEPVTIDTHAHDIAYGQKLPWATNRGLGAVGRYDTFADAYRQATHKLDVATPGELQAITWTAWRQLYGRKRADSL